MQYFNKLENLKKRKNLLFLAYAVEPQVKLFPRKKMKILFKIIGLREIIIVSLYFFMHLLYFIFDFM